MTDHKALSTLTFQCSHGLFRSDLLGLVIKAKERRESRDLYLSPGPATRSTCSLERALGFCSLWIGRVVITTTALVASPDGDQDPSNELWAFKSAHMTGSHRRILSRVALQDGSSRLQTPAPSLAPAAQTPLPRPPLLLRRGCTASVAVLASAFCSHGKPASFFANLYNAISLPLWLSVPASPTQPREHCLGG